MKTSNPVNQRKRTGFTLVELLVAITVVAILVGMLTAAVIPALRRGREASVQTEMKQIELAIENFKNQYGFYPPSFESGLDVNGNVRGIANAADLLRYVNRISPNHSELQTHPVHTTETRLEHWWEEVGQFLDQESSLVFWLSGLCKNKQYPITGGSNLPGAPLAAHGLIDDGIERDVFFEFKQNQLVGDEDGETIVSNRTSTTIQSGDPLWGFIFEYEQAYGPQDGDLLYRYRDAPTYDLGGNNAYSIGPVQGTVPNAFYDFANPKTFQLITFGMDGLSGVTGDIFTTGPQGDDNLVNFADGRLDRFVNERR